MWHKVAKVSDISDGAGQSLEIEGRSIALFNVQGKFYAIDNRCMHRGGPLAEGHLEGNIVTCPWHAWQFDVTSGECETMKGSKQMTYKTKIENDFVWIDLAETAAGPAGGVSPKNPTPPSPAA